MILPLALCAVWMIAANVIAMFPSRDYHWRAAYVLIAVGVPLLGWVTWEGGPIIGSRSCAGRWSTSGAGCAASWVRR